MGPYWFAVLVVLVSATLMVFPVVASAQEREAFHVWPGEVPDGYGNTPSDIPSLTVYRPDADKATGAAVVVCPGGGYGGLAMGHEGEDIGRWFNDSGITAFVLRYRHSPYRHPIPMNDAKRAMRLVRHRAKDLGVDPARIGIMGFSAGGHLAATVGTLFDAGDASASDPVERESCRPDFMILCYPVLTLKAPFAHMGSRHNLLGEASDDRRLVKSLSHENNVTDDTPPTFIFHTADDPAVPVENSLLFFMALRRHNVPAEMHVFEHGRHGVGLAPDMENLAVWPDLCITWLKAHGMLSPRG